MIKAFGYLVSNVIVLLLCNYIPNVRIEVVPAVFFVLVLTLLNWTVVPIIKLFALPFNFFTFGLVNWVINVSVFFIMVTMIRGITIEGGLVNQLLFSVFVPFGFSFGHSIVNLIFNKSE